VKNIISLFIVGFLFLAIYNNSKAQPVPQQIIPLNGSKWEYTSPTLLWLLYNTYTAVSFSVQVSLSQFNFTNPYLVIDTTSTGTVSGIYFIPAGKLSVGITYYWRIGFDGNYSPVWNFTPYAEVSSGTLLISPTLIEPHDSSNNVSLNPTLFWTGVSGATSYEIQVSQSNNFLITIADINNIATTSNVISGLTSGSTYYWRVRALNSIGISNWTGNFIFTTQQLPSIPTLVESNFKIPIQFVLMQNYPNPFNPSTIINYSISKFCFVNINVYDVSGKEASTLVNENKPAGNYFIQFKASNLVSGVYFYRMTAGDFVQTKKLILLK
jgi:hypothetical protein